MTPALPKSVFVYTWVWPAHPEENGISMHTHKSECEHHWRKDQEKCGFDVTPIARYARVDEEREKLRDAVVEAAAEHRKAEKRVETADVESLDESEFNLLYDLMRVAEGKLDAALKAYDEAVKAREEEGE